MRGVEKRGGYIKSYLKETAGVSAMIFALLLPVIIASAGMAVDLAQAYNVKNRLSNALDKAALAVASSSGSQAQLQTVFSKYFVANFPDAKLGTPYNVNLTVNGDKIDVSASAQVNTILMRMLGTDTINVSASSEVVRELSGIEVALVLDVTGSMAGSRIASLKTAATNFLNIMFGRVTDPQYIKIGIVPYSDSVNVGPYGLGMDDNGNPYGTPFVDRPTTDDYVSDPSTITYDLSNSNQWHGCITERSSPLDTTDDPPTPNWGMYRWPRRCYWYYNGQCQWWSGNPNQSCPVSEIVPLTNDQTKLQNAINNLQTGGNTYGNVGMAWGWHVLSSTPPFTEGVSETDKRWSRTVIMMTDGNNTVASYYSVYGLTANNPMTVTDLNNKFEDVCTNMKQHGITIYTITFQSDITDSTRAYYRQCASDPSKYYDAPTDQDLIDAFNTIADQLSKLHITK